MVDGVIQPSTLCLEFGIASLQSGELQFKQNSDQFHMIEQDFNLTSLNWIACCWAEGWYSHL